MLAIAYIAHDGPATYQLVGGRKYVKGTRYNITSPAELETLKRSGVFVIEEPLPPPQPGPTPEPKPEAAPKRRRGRPRKGSKR